MKVSHKIGLFLNWGNTYFNLSQKKSIALEASFTSLDIYLDKKKFKDDKDFKKWEIICYKYNQVITNQEKSFFLMSSNKAWNYYFVNFCV
jgi:hypothetical protein